MSLTTGARLGPYEIASAIGAGGMGEVFRARDTTLNRDVAIKVLPAAMASEPERLARFKREAQVLASFPGHAGFGIHRALLSGRPLSRLRLGRVRPRGGLRSALSGHRSQVADLDCGRLRAGLAQRHAGGLLPVFRLPAHVGDGLGVSLGTLLRAAAAALPRLPRDGSRCH